MQPDDGRNVSVRLQRDAALKAVRSNGEFDVIVLGGGINGIGVFRELSLQNLRVLLVERRDFCSGCSSAPSRMIHGGLRYLENGEFGLVRESLRERDALLRNAPHMVRPLPTTIPIRKVFSGMLNGVAGFLGLSSRPSSRGALPIKIGLMLYDWNTRHRRLLPRHKFRGARETLARWPKLNPHLRFSATYFDAWISYPERLCIELLLDTARMAPRSVALNYAEIKRSGDGFLLADRTNGETMEVRARAIVNATGAWLDEARASLANGKPPQERFVAGTKGSHLIIDNAELREALGGHMIFFENEDGRVCILFPYLGKVLAGATDIRVDTPDRVRCEPEEREFILGAIREVFPDIRVREEEIVFSFSGIRPLPKSDHEFTGRIPRSHYIRREDGPVPQFCMIGGKWTTFRAFAEQATDAVLAELGQPRIRGTLDLQIGGGANFPSSQEELERRLVEEHGISTRRAAWLAGAYGAWAEEVLSFCRGRDDDRPLSEGTEISEAEIAWLARSEMAVELEDMLLRRTPLAIRGELSLAIVHRVAEVMAAQLGWSESRRQEEIDRFLYNLETYHGVSRETLERRSLQGSLQCE